MRMTRLFAARYLRFNLFLWKDKIFYSEYSRHMHFAGWRYELAEWLARSEIRAEFLYDFEIYVKGTIFLVHFELVFSQLENVIIMILQI